MLVWLTLPFYDFCGFRSVAVNSVHKLQFCYIYNNKWRCRIQPFPADSQSKLIGLVCGLAATRCLVCIYQMNRVNSWHDDSTRIIIIIIITIITRTVVVDVLGIILIGRKRAVERRAQLLSRRSFDEFDGEAVGADVDDATKLVAVERVRHPHLLAVIHHLSETQPQL